jgi:FtsP/CotA-like multicopper oxidase with cupredoxin domain
LVLAVAVLAFAADQVWAQGFNPAVNCKVPNWSNSPNLRKFVDSLPGLTYANRNNLGQYIPIANPDTVTYPGSDYYEIGLAQYQEQMHSDLPTAGTLLRGYYQMNAGTVGATDNVNRYLGPLIIAKRDRPVRLKFTNLLGINGAGDLSLPVDTTVMGAGMGPVGGMMYTQNRATIHLHGGFTPWISDGTPHQWVTPSGDATPYQKGASFQNVPDMVGAGKSIPTPAPGDGMGTFYYPNQQSARLMFYHDHAYPYVELPPTAVRLRILNACNDRMLNLQLYKAEPANPTEVKMVPAVPNAAYPTWPKDGRDGGVPDPTTQGPSWVQIGNECGFLAQVAVVPPQPVDYDYNRKDPTFGGVTSRSLHLLPAGRADVIVDLSAYSPGDVLIVYNDAPAPMPLYDTRYDYYTGDPDQTAAGGAPATPAGFGPNTRTIMQIRIVAGTTTPFNLAALQTMLPAAFRVAQDPIIVPNSAYDAAYNAKYTDIYCRSVDDSLNVTGAPQPVASVMTELPGLGYTTPPTVTFYGGGGTGAAATAALNGVTGITVVTAGTGYTSPPTVTLTGGGGTGATATAIITLGSVGAITLTNPGSGYTSAPQVNLTGGGGSGARAIAMLAGVLVMNGKNLTEGFDTDYGRMNVVLGSTPNPLAPTVGLGPVVGLARYIDPPTEILTADQPVLWRLMHLGVDSHAIHFHLFNVQVVNRVDYANIIKPPYPDEIGWRETIRTNPFEDVIVAIKPLGSMKLPFVVPQSNRLLDPTTPLGSTVNFLPVAPPIGLPAVAQLTNVMTNFGWEYVWHCHLLGHEENDMMRPIVFNIPLPAAPTNLTAASPATVNAPAVTLTWRDHATNESGFTVQRATNTGFTAGLKTVYVLVANTTVYSDTTVAANTRYYYRVAAMNGGGNSAWSNTATVTSAKGALPQAPTNLMAGVATTKSVPLSWTIVGANTGVVIQRATNPAFTPGAVLTTVNTPNVAARTITGLRTKTTYYFRVAEKNAVGQGAWSNVVVATTL